LELSQTDGLDTALVTCAVIRTGHPTSLAAFAATSSSNEALVTQLLADPILMRDMLVAGGPFDSADNKGDIFYPKFGPAMEIYTAILKAVGGSFGGGASNSTLWDDRSPSTILKRLAVGVAVGLAAPLGHRYAAWSNATSALVDPVERYQYFADSYKAGNLDPAFPVRCHDLSAFFQVH
jgi:hypothetical protein